jgi:serine/threonine protein kinase
VSCLPTESPAGTTTNIVLCSEFSTKDLKSVGNYTLGRLIGKGSFGKVYLATHKLTNGSKVWILGQPVETFLTYGRWFSSPPTKAIRILLERCTIIGNLSTRISLGSTKL